jgi:hypothetical protein
MSGRKLAGALVVSALLAAAPVRADDAATVTYKSIAPDTALDLAKAALTACRNRGIRSRSWCSIASASSLCCCAIDLPACLQRRPPTTRPIPR